MAVLFRIHVRRIATTDLAWHDTNYGLPSFVHRATIPGTAKTILDKNSDEGSPYDQSFIPHRGGYRGDCI